VPCHRYDNVVRRAIRYSFGIRKISCVNLRGPDQCDGNTQPSLYFFFKKKKLIILCQTSNYMVTLRTWTSVFEWYMTRLVLRMVTKKTCGPMRLACVTIVC
jgi:hypothetical protein